MATSVVGQIHGYIIRARKSILKVFPTTVEFEVIFEIKHRDLAIVLIGSRSNVDMFSIVITCQCLSDTQRNGL